MKIKFFIFLLCFVALPYTGFASRKVISFNQDWSFRLEQTQDPVMRKYQHWTAVNLPHDWSVELGYSDQNTAGCTGYMPGGVGWYRKSFTMSSDDQARVHRLEFDGVYRDAQIFLNGKKIYARPYGFISFSVDVTPYLNYSKSNELIVKVDRKKYQDCRWYPGSGIYRPVRMVSSHPTHIPQWGVSITTPQISEEQAQVAVVAEVQSAFPQQGVIEQLILNEQGQVVAKHEQKFEAHPAAPVQQKQTITLPNPQRWDIDRPYLYLLKTIVKDTKGVILDETQTRFGVRDFHFDANKGFFLNGKNHKLKGVCLHQDLGSAGVATTKAMWRPVLQQFKDMGCNSIRCAHNPPSTEFLELCDEMGFIVQDEILDEWRVNKNKWTHHKGRSDQDFSATFGYGDIYEEWAEQDVKDWVKRDRNHPSIMMWSLGNEIEWTYPYYWRMEKSSQPLSNAVLVEQGGGERELANTAQELHDWVRALDTTRPTTTGMVSPRAGTITGYTDIVDLAGYNYRPDYYQEDHTKHPNRIIYGSENHPQYREWRDCMAHDFIAGIYVWTGLSYLGEAVTAYPHRGAGLGAFIDLGMFPAPSYYMFKSLWNDEKMVYLATQPYKACNYLVEGKKIVENPKNKRPDQWGWADVKPHWQYQEGEMIYVESYANCEEVELQLNGKVIARHRMADQPDRIIKWVLPYTKGELKAVGYENGKAVTSNSLYSVDTQSPYQLKLELSQPTLQAATQDALWLKAYLVDAHGNRVVHEETTVDFEIQGPIVNKGVNHGNPYYMQPFKATSSITDWGRCSLLLESTQQKGKVTVKATPKGGKPTTVSFYVK